MKQIAAEAENPQCGHYDTKAALHALIDEIEISERALGFQVVKSDTLAKARKLLNRKEFTISTTEKR